MCGFIGSAAFNGQPAPRMPDHIPTRVRWRGPDSYGEMSSRHHCMGSARLAVIDLDPEANQPLATPDGAWELVYNGEIYNYRELADEHSLSARARRSDSWTILELIAAIGVERACQSLRGMYAFAVWEKAADRLWLARDPFGIKPLAWTRIKNGLLFGSDPRTLASWLHFLGVSPGIDAYALTHFLMVGYIPGDATIWEGIDRVPAGSVVAIDARAATAKDWDPLSDHSTTPIVTVDELDTAFRASIARHLVADVEVGAFLSGGIDSSLLVAIARGEFDVPMRTYSVGFDSDKVTDEAASAAKMAGLMGTRHVGLTLGADSFRSLAESVAEAFPEPHADPAAMPTLALSLRAQSEVKVVLTGEGGDEMFGGYRRYWALPLARGRIARGARILGLARIAREMGGRRVRQIAESTQAEPGAGYLRYLTQVHWDEVTPVSTLCTPTMVARVVERYQPNRWERATPRTIRRLELRRHLPETYLEKTDRATMRHGLEARVPFLDLDLASVAFRLASHQMARPGRTKLLLREVASRYLPAAVAKGPKVGFEVPLVDWLSPPATSRWIRESLLEGEAVQRGILDRAALPRMVDGFGGVERGDNSQALYRLLNLELWCRSATGDRAL